MKLSEAFSIYLHEVQARNRSHSTIKNYDYLFRYWTRYAVERGLTDLGSFTQEEIRLWRDSWTTSTSTTKLRLTLMRTFFRFAVKEGWIDHFPMGNILSPKVKSKPTLPLDFEEMRSLIVSAGDCTQEKALILLMRYAGLSIQDAVTCSRDHIKGDTLILRRAKTDELVIAYLPDPVIESLHRITLNGRPYFFWSGESKPISATNCINWQRSRDETCLPIIVVESAAHSALPGCPPRRIRPEQRDHRPLDAVGKIGPSTN